MWQWLLGAPWALFVAWWIFRAFGTARTESRESPRQRMTHVALIGAGSLFVVAPPPALARQLWPVNVAILIAALALETVGVAFAIWAREHLGALWSGTVTLKEGHRIVQSGPYRLARHPIYTGLVLAFAGSVLARGTLAALVGLALFVAGIARKIMIEETMLGERFGDEYATYRKKVAAIIPFIL